MKRPAARLLFMNFLRLRPDIIASLFFYHCSRVEATGARNRA
ncbi:MAG: hypothetical protein OP8BY_1362 [Candidatus Saccharicenans subterraneus]|uniref:Uncharacterized protein n=1 Tax=Candidatus Saccharicenans subterraneus TaxID=2508984 RepID=A0A3E2BPV4_9BACT|nr:MAG: hypothetical protein OP8BY_1362 [Candidatus Saccharicenans subterraneum]